MNVNTNACVLLPIKRSWVGEEREIAVLPRAVITIIATLSKEQKSEVN